MDNYPKKLIEQYLKASNKLKKFDRVVFKRFAPNVSEVLEDFNRLSLTMEEAGIYQYAAMCHLGAAKCEKSIGNNICEVNSYLKSARAFLKANDTVESLYLRSNKGEYIEGAMKAYNLALSRITDDSVLKAAVIREITILNQNFDITSSFTSPSHRIYDLQLSANKCLKKHDFLAALEKLTDIVDNICERKKQHLYTHLLSGIEISRLLLLVILNLSPSRQSPSHIKLIEYYHNFDVLEDNHDFALSLSQSMIGNFIPLEIKYVLSNIVIAWCDSKKEDLKFAVEELSEFFSLHEVHKFLINHIMDKLN